MEEKNNIKILLKKKGAAIDIYFMHCYFLIPLLHVAQDMRITVSAESSPSVKNVD